jgi:hypothetical protein
MSSFQEIAHKKIAGVPMLYLAGAFVVVLGVVAWRMKPSADAPPEESPSDGGTDAQLDDNGHADGSNPYAGYSGNGTVIVAPQQPAPDNPEDTRPGSNDEWVRQGAEWLVADKKVNGQAAYVALNKYINGQSRSYQESSWVDQVIAAKGLPPESFTGTPPTTTNPPPPSTKPPVVKPPAPKPAPVTMKAPTKLKASGVTKSYVKLDWAPLSGVKGYVLYQNGKRIESVVYSSSGQTGLHSNTTYKFQVRGLYPGDKQGPASAIVTVHTKK